MPLESAVLRMELAAELDGETQKAGSGDLGRPGVLRFALSFSGIFKRRWCFHRFLFLGLACFSGGFFDCLALQQGAFWG